MSETLSVTVDYKPLEKAIKTYGKKLRLSKKEVSKVSLPHMKTAHKDIVARVAKATKLPASQVRKRIRITPYIRVKGKKRPSSKKGVLFYRRIYAWGQSGKVDVSRLQTGSRRAKHVGKGANRGVRVPRIGQTFKGAYIHPRWYSSNGISRKILMRPDASRGPVYSATVLLDKDIYKIYPGLSRAPIRRARRKTMVAVRKMILKKAKDAARTTK